MALINFKERIQILLKLKESLIPQVDGNFVKDWESEALNYQNNSENIIIYLKDIKFIEGLINPISAQLTFLRINLQNYENMSEKEKDKFKRLYVLAALGLIAKLKLVLFFSTYINAKEKNHSKNFPVLNENYYNAENYNCENNYEDKMSLMNNSCDHCVNNDDQKNASLFNQVDDYYTQFHACTDDYKENIFNMMALNSIHNYNSQVSNDKSISDNEYMDSTLSMYDNYVDMASKSMNSNQVGSTHVNANHMGSNDMSSNHMGSNHMESSYMGSNHMESSYMDSNQMDNNHMNGNHMNGNHMNGNHMNGNHMNGNHMNGNHMNGNYMNGNHMNSNHMNGNHINSSNNNSLFLQNIEDYTSNKKTHFAPEKNEGQQNIPVVTSKKRNSQVSQCQRKTIDLLKNSHTLNGIKNSQNERMQNYELLNNETQRFLQQNQDQISKYINNIHQNIHAPNNENIELNNFKSNINNYYEYDYDNSQENNILQSYNNEIYGLSDNVYKNSYFL
ncbi:hypothetical protein, conserved [Plasmodium gonderi]|uniref:Uncharacterized protein n=1 Tax=Plasmodium gonderi TaxID=77519 RepID=A0A1Y1JMP0_PLAGO|nr:hypothetical protein, conserved [Plasmodium gonderi]GAW81304.1 hypothetical protein, conserved [Plasmodium gonderi]